MPQNNDIYDVIVSGNAVRQLKKTPLHIKEKFYKWVKQVKEIGLSEVRKIKSYHDEPLHGNRENQRSIRLNNAYRAIYIIKKDNTIKFAMVQEINKHDY